MDIRRNLRRRALLPLFLSFLPALLLISCGNGDAVDTDPQTRPVSSGDQGTPETGDWVVVHNRADPETLNKITSTDATSQELHSYMYETLMQTHPITLKPIPWIADSLPKVSDDRLSYEFRIRKGVTFSDGKPVTAHDFIFHLKTIKNPHILKAAPVRSYYSRVDSAELIDGDPYRLRVVMAEPYYLGEQWAGGLYAFPKHIWDPKGLTDKVSFAELNAGDTLKNPAAKTFADFVQDPSKDFDPKYTIASGPYIFEFYRQNDRIVLKRNANYWNAQHELGKAYPDRVVYITISDQNAALSALKAKELDFVPRLTQVQFRYEKERFPKNGIVPGQYEYPAYNYVGYNAASTEKPFLGDAKVRMAFAHALDRQMMVDKIFFGNAVPVQSPIYTGRPEYDTSIALIKYDLGAAKKLLDEAGWKDSDGDGVRDKVVNGKKVRMEFSLMMNADNPNRKQMAVIFAGALKQIGVIANVSLLEWAVFLDQLDKHQFDAYIGGWAQPVEEGDMFQIWHSSSTELGGSNYVSFKNPKVDELIETIRGEFDYEKRRTMYSEIQKIIYDEQPYNFLVSETYVCGYSDRFRNVSFFAPRPCFNAGWWWVPKDQQRYTVAGQAVAMN